MSIHELFFHFYFHSPSSSFSFSDILITLSRYFRAVRLSSQDLERSKDKEKPYSSIASSNNERRRKKDPLTKVFLYM
ncbi:MULTISPECIES: hypothetical protein [Bacillus cereus group]|uniref:hypothetical protein n=1 Tax=Bacillus cereus group TaxID=86661 RepID=UPI00111FCDD0|nr:MULTISPECIES: hypothetical protein [Bacillus cereus group]MDH2859185.1 hypothetical protein [Bacillus cytotoxicus]MDH2864500.1 hypothetical protein [Bacillus cytotoxicus]MDH2868431.1 hypothetical protein [Bacillus cytotoxicus]MDH2870799.1 hypothetical protein [Bacillus cytotoxicus]MDH2875173.1 hypothetical protein [Bacillus cytotoxicus]